MTRRSPLSRCLAVLALLLLAALLHAEPRSSSAREPAKDEVRALWVQRTTLTSPAAITQLVSSARAAGFNTLLVQVRGRGDAFFNDSIEPRAAALAGQPASFDPLATVLASAKAAGLRVHAWINIGLVASATQLPEDRKHVIYSHPEWLMVPRALAGEMGTVERDSPEYVGKLARYARAQSATVEGLYLSPVADEAIAYTVSIVADLVKRYDVDGVHFDYLRYPNSDFDYSPTALARFRRDLGGSPTRAERERYDARLGSEPAVYTEAYPERWSDFRRARLTTLATRLHDAVKSGRPDVLISAAVLPDAREAFTSRLQDWPLWADRGLLDVLCPMAYTDDQTAFRAQIQTVRRLAGDRPVWAGIGAYRLSSSETIENILTARDLGARGVVLFSYDNLTSPSGGEVLADIGRAVFDH